MKETELKYEGVTGKERRRGGGERWADRGYIYDFYALILSISLFQEDYGNGEVRGEDR